MIKLSRFERLLVGISKYKVVYFALNLTWGLLMTLIGYIVFAFLYIIKLGKRKVMVYRGMPCMQLSISGSWGFELGTCCFISSDISIEDIELIAHEYGHTCQNAVFGPLYPILVGIPSIIRFWYRDAKIRHRKPLKTAYDDIWFEGTASRAGVAAFIRAGIML